jgi:TolB-like protein/uncharacterized damage-inducible protein DinB
MLVSRQELQHLLWPDGTFVEFDDGLNSCIKQIRRALRDDRVNPRYLETLSRRGYRFIAPVHAAPDAVADARLRVGIVPFQGLMTEDPAREIAEGLTEEVTTQLAIAGQRGGVSVVAGVFDSTGNPSSAMPGDTDFVLTGSVRLSAARFRIAVQLIDTRNHAHAWAAMFDGDLHDVLGAQARIAACIVSGVLQTLFDETTQKGRFPMKSVALIAGIVLALLSSISKGYAQAPAQPDTVTILAANKQMYQTIRGYLLASAEKLPEADYAFKPTPDVRSYGAIIGHVSNAMFGSCAALKGEANPNTSNLEETTAREAIVTNLRKAATYCDEAVNGLTESSASEPVRRGQRSIVRIAPLMTLVAHLNEHYGNLVTYMRLKGVVPPSSDKTAATVK